MDLRVLRYFVAVAEELHFGRAAARVHIAQPSLTIQIRKLEQELGCQLLNRSKRRVELTEPGRFLLESARLMLQQADATIRGVRAAGQGVIGRIEVALVGSATLRPQVFNALRAFRQQCPGVAVTLRVMTSVEQIRAIQQGDIHIGFLRAPVPNNSISSQPFVKEELLAALPHGHRLADKKIIKPTDLRGEPFVMLPHHAGFSLWKQVMDLCHQAEFEPTISQEATDLQTITGLVAAGFGVSLVPSSATMLPRRGVVYKPLNPSSVVEIVAAFSRSAVMPPALKVFLEVLHKTISAK